jgi:poly-beta-1,6-N-acetyl-D-glucosamine biosynthesis protein PgaD
MKDQTEPNYIIDDASRLSTLRKGTEWSITIFAWSAWIYFFMPLLTLLLWTFGVRFAVVEGVMLDHAAGLASVALYYLAGLTVVVVILQGWSLYNKKRYGGLDRRSHPEAVSDAELAQYFWLTEETVELARSADNVIVSFEGGGISVVACPDGK